MTEAVDSEFPSLFCHESRADWGVGVFSGERDGKRRYLFEGGEERTMAAAHHHLMRKVEHPDRDQQATYARLMALLAKREGREPPGVAHGTQAVIKQLEKFRLKYPAGFCSDGWLADERNVRVRRARDGASQRAQEELSLKSLERIVKAKRLEDVWAQVVALVAESGLVSEELASTSNPEQQRVLGEAVRDLLHGSDRYERRFDRFVMRYESVFRNAPGWQATTALPALFSPVDHVCVEPVSFRKQLKALSRQSTLGARPSGSAYQRCLGMARTLAGSLATQGEVPADLLEVHAFVRATV